MRQGMRSARVTTFTSEPGRILWPTLARARSGQVVLLSSCEGQEIRRWDMFTGRMLWCSADAWSANALAVASPPGGNPVVAVATEDGVLRLDALTGAELDGYEMAADDTIWDVATGILPDGRAFIAGAAIAAFGCTDGTRRQVSPGPAAGRPHHLRQGHHSHHTARRHCADRLGGRGRPHPPLERRIRPTVRKPHPRAR